MSFASLLLALLPASPASATQEVDAARVAQVIEGKCAECHTPEAENAKAKRHFDSARDLARTVEEYVAPGDLFLSELWSQIESGEMPPEDAAAGRLTAQESDLIRSWILAGAPLPVETTVGGEELVPHSGGPQSGAIESSTEQSAPAWLQIGRFHPMSTHFPIAFLLGAGMLELLIILRRGSGLTSTARVLVRMAALFAPLTAILGWLNAQDSTAASATLVWHRWLGMATAVLTAALLLASELAARPGASRQVYRALLFASCAAVGWAGHLGGTLVFGEGYLPF